MTERERAILSWAARLSGMDKQRLLAGQKAVSTWDIASTNQLLQYDMDALVSAALLAEGVDDLVRAGVERTRLLGKLRRDPSLWPTWAEIRAAAILVGAPGAERLVFEPDRSQGRHSDYLFFSDSFPDGIAIEFKALGRSDAETRFCEAWAREVIRIHPARGLVSFHAPFDLSRWSLSARDIREIELEAEHGVPALPAHLRRIAGVSIIAHGTEEGYLIRLRRQLQAALGQLPDRSCMVAFHWGNGAPLDLIRHAASTVDLPENVRGVMLIGSVLFVPAPPIHNFVFLLPTPFDGGDVGETEFRSAVSDDLAEAVFGAVDHAAGLRATILRAPGRGQHRKFDLVLRDGSRRLDPFNLLLDKDPPWDEPYASMPVGAMRRLRQTV